MAAPTFQSGAYTRYGNTNPDGSGVSIWQAFKDVVSHPIDSLRAFFGAPLALAGGALVRAGEFASGINTPLVGDLPGQEYSDLVFVDGKLVPLSDLFKDPPTTPRADGTTGEARPTVIGGSSSPQAPWEPRAGGAPTWLKFAGVAALLLATVIITRKALQ